MVLAAALIQLVTLGDIVSASCFERCVPLALALSKRTPVRRSATSRAFGDVEPIGRFIDSGLNFLGSPPAARRGVILRGQLKGITCRDVPDRWKQRVLSAIVWDFMAEQSVDTAIQFGEALHYMVYDSMECTLRNDEWWWHMESVLRQPLQVKGDRVDEVVDLQKDIVEEMEVARVHMWGILTSATYSDFEVDPFLN